jgi:tRNA U38,U39,U40 pseudouridine synthase TruA
MPAASPEARRHVHSFACGGTVVLGGTTWVRLVVTGQSFMLHQIRKMVRARLLPACLLCLPACLPACLQLLG